MKQSIVLGLGGSEVGGMKNGAQWGEERGESLEEMLNSDRFRWG